MSVRRAPLLALAAGLVLPGLGQVYCGDVARGLAVLLGVAVLPVVTAWLALQGPARILSLVVVLGVVAGVVLYAWSAFDAFRLARRQPESASAWQRPIVYLLSVVVAYLLLLGPMVSYARDNLLETFNAPTASMTPSILPGDLFLADKRVNHLGGVALWRGAVGLFIYPSERVNIYVKRIIGLPGDHIEIEGNSLRVNGRELRGAEVHDLGDPALNRLLADHDAFLESGDRSPYVVLWPKQGQPAKASFEVPMGQVFVLDDNRGASVDSRRFGTIPVADVKAVARQVILSRNGELAFPWSRAGALIQ
jgi:signal peptidase I